MSQVAYEQLQICVESDFGSVCAYVVLCCMEYHVIIDCIKTAPDHIL